MTTRPRHPKTTRSEHRDTIRRLTAQGMKPRAIATILGLSVQWVSRIVMQQREEPKRRAS